MQTVSDISIFERNRIRESSLWNIGEQKDLLLHRIHAYPAKFPPFLVSKLLEYFELNGKDIRVVADVFCGCGTSALETAKLGKDFWGCDINPVATLIARTKSRTYQSNYLQKLEEEILLYASTSKNKTAKEYYDNERLNYWYDKVSLNQLYLLLNSIKAIVPEGKYRDFFLTGFSNILKPCSRWLAKSIKPQIDPNKIPANPYMSFKNQISMMIKAVNEANEFINFKSRVHIVKRNLLELDIKASLADVIITSPPYVTSYEYADLHQLSSIWLGFANDYRDLRNGSIGSGHSKKNTDELYEFVNQTAKSTYDKLFPLDHSRAKSVLRYFYDLELAVKKIRQIGKKSASVAFVIGNTTYKGVTINNAKALAQDLLQNNFTNIKVSKRKISSKNLTPYRNKFGQFDSSSQSLKIYSHEYILLAEINS